MDTIELDFAPAPAAALPPPRADRRADAQYPMDKLVIEGGTRLSGTIGVSGAKNAALPILCASLLAPEPLVLANVPQLNDVRTMRTLLAQMGVACQVDGDRLTLEQYLKRQLVFAFQPRRYSYFPKATKNNVSSAKPGVESARSAIRPIAFQWNDAGWYWLMTVWLVVIGAYVLYWAYFLDGTKDAAFWIEQIIR